MITVSQVSGPVFITDEKGTREVTNGMSITNPGGKTMIVTGDGGRVTLSSDGKNIQLSPKSWMQLKPHQSSVWDFFWSGKDIKIGAGKAWAFLYEHMGGRYEGEINEGNCVVGVRG